MTVFDGNTEGTDQSQNTESETQASLFENLVGDDKKFKTPEDLAKGKAEADAFIQKLQEENEALRQDLDKRLSQEEILEQLKSKQQQEAPAQDDNTNHQASPEDIAKLVKETVQGLSQEERTQKNISEADSVMKEKFGEKAAEVLSNKAKEIGVSISFLESTAAQSPKAFYELMGIDRKTTGTPSSSEGTVNTEALVSNSGPAKEDTMEYYNNLRKESPRLYWSPKIQNKIFEIKKKELGL